MPDYIQKQTWLEQGFGHYRDATKWGRFMGISLSVSPTQKEKQKEAEGGGG